MLVRRSFLTSMGALLGASGLLPSGVSAAEQCEPSRMGLVCSSYIPIQKLAKVYAAQYMSEWCWAASISMIFGYNDHVISQQKIVNDAYGGIANVPGNFPALFGSLNRTWTDEAQTDFDVAVDHLYAPDVGVSTLTNADLVAALEQEQPVLFCTMQHAMVLTSMRYIGGQVVEAWVMDPWPGRGLRRLMQAELIPTVLGGSLRMAATLNVS